ncbi:hypothetical protein K1719_038708 [Acacia pycnantha]|nr:hypothetical protein K1719_038708 [Acacia pycnantha]
MSGKGGGGGGSGNGKGGNGLAGVPALSRKMVQSLKEIVSNFPKHEIYAMLKECDMDPNEATSGNRKDKLLMASSSNQTTDNKKKLYYALMKENWPEVVKLFEDHPEIHGTKIAEMVPKKERADAGDDQYESDTALHWAITFKADELTVEKLVFEIRKKHSSVGDKAMEILKSKNKLEDTPLHCAATRGSKRICKAILENDLSLPELSLVIEPNKDGETPLFLAALNGNESTFFYLHLICKGLICKDKDSQLPFSIWKRTDGDTILHCTIRRKNFGLSYKIIQHFKQESIGSYFNKDGKLPLDEIVSIPSAFNTCILMRG